jgi:hypothetical protein
MAEHESSPADDPPPPATGPSGDGDQSAPRDDDRPSKHGPRFGLPSIDWSRTRLRVAHAARVGLKATIVVVVVSVALGTASFVTASFYGQYGAIRNTPNAQTWAGLTPRFAGPAICTSCHAPEAGAQDASIHGGVSCENCHGPAGAHSISAEAARVAVLARPTSGICVTCHAATAGRPTTFPQIDPDTHYAGGPCLRCHDPHSIVAVRPPTVSHPLANLPECTTCHAPDGLKKIPAGHEVVGDKVCLACHGAAADGKPE